MYIYSVKCNTESNDYTSNTSLSSSTFTEYLLGSNSHPDMEKEAKCTKAHFHEAHILKRGIQNASGIYLIFDFFFT
jgi:hypothetical protein